MDISGALLIIFTVALVFAILVSTILGSRKGTHEGFTEEVDGGLEQVDDDSDDSEDEETPENREEVKKLVDSVGLSTNEAVTMRRVLDGVSDPDTMKRLFKKGMLPHQAIEKLVTAKNGVTP